MPAPFLPPELWTRIIQLAFDSTSYERIPTFLPWRTVNRTFERIVTENVLSTVAILDLYALEGYIEHYSRFPPEYAEQVRTLFVNWDLSIFPDRPEMRRAGGKVWRNKLRRLCSSCTRVKRVEMTGPDRRTGLFLSLDWFEPLQDSLESLVLSKLLLASYPNVSRLRFERVRSLTLIDCHPYALSQARAFFRHFPNLVSLEIDNDNCDKTLIEAALVSSDPSNRYVPSLQHLVIPQSHFLALFTPFPLVTKAEPRQQEDQDETLPTPSHVFPNTITSLVLTRVTFPPPLLDPLRQFVLKYALLGGGQLERLEFELEQP
ncbi:uncharacterized protein JCM15063_003868 [Sporobolomyces koalae]|uniref:uncharacterized protein n=1 Tax=Sporobolomyces koalae TaxID=500713 RepID=UPI00317C038A